ncbi:MAG: ankyrin repeat domain-containing protein, partial [Proteobacteria bacterium]|nr:ankyrin repeat domain-containing protein [Pseudomonadota bacterium]
RKTIALKTIKDDPPPLMVSYGGLKKEKSIMKMKNIQKLTLVIALLSHTAFASISADYRLLDALNTANPSLATIQKLLTIPAVKDNINLQDSNSMTALMYAVSAANLPLTQALIAAGAKTTPPADQANNSDTALFIAVSQETPSLPIVKVLLQAPDIKDSINLQNSAGLTALMWAANKGNLPITKALLAAGANPTIMTPQGQTAWSFAAPNCQSLLPIPPSAKANSDLLNAVFNVTTTNYRNNN